MASNILAVQTPAELEALHQKFRRARKAARKVMSANWWDTALTDRYGRMVQDLQADDPLFAANVVTPPMPPKPWLMAVGQWRIPEKDK